MSLLIFIGFSMFLTEWPTYVKLVPSFPDCVYTRIEEKSTIQWYSGFPGNAGSETFVWRKYFLVNSRRCGTNLNSKDKIFSHLEQWLDEEGWYRWDELGSPCSHLREAGFLERGEDYVAYIPKGKTSLNNTPAVCLAVWPEGNDFWVLFATRKYNFLRSGLWY